MKLAVKVLVFLPLCFSIALASGLTYRQVRGPETNQDVTVTAQAPPQQQRSYTVFHADSLLNNSKSLPGREYHNYFFDFTYRIPAGWIVEKSEITLKRNKMATVHVKPQGSALTAETLKITSPIILLNATPVDVADRERLGLPCVSISVNPAGPEPLSLETVKKSLQSGESLGFGLTFGSAPLSNSILTASTSPRMIAQRSGVILESSNSFRSAPVATICRMAS